MKNIHETNSPNALTRSIGKTKNSNISAKKNLLFALSLVVSMAPYTSFCQNSSGRNFLAERAYEARMTGYSTPSKEEEMEIAELEKNTPKNIITNETMYLFYFKNKGVQYVESLDENSWILQNYLSFVKKVSLKQLDVFDRRRAVQAAKEDIKKEMSELDYNTVYSCPIILTDMGEYNFKSHSMIASTQNASNLLGECASFKFVASNMYWVGNAIGLQMNEENAEALTKWLHDKNVRYNLSIVYFFKVDPKLITTKSGKTHLTAAVSKMGVYYRVRRNNKWYFGDNILETRLPTTPVPHPELN